MSLQNNIYRFLVPAIVLLVFHMGSPVEAASKLSFDDLTINLGGTVTGITTANVAGDSMTDLIVTSAEGSGTKVRRFVNIFIQRRRSGFPVNPDFKLPLPVNATALTTADIFGGKSREILILGPKTISTFKRTATGSLESELVPVIKIKSRYSIAALETIEHLQGNRDINGDGRDDLLIPAGGGYVLLTGRPLPQGGLVKAREFAVTETLQYKLGYGTKWFTMTQSVPACTVIDHNGDGRLDVTLYQERKLTTFLQKADGAFSTTGITEQLGKVVGTSAKRDELTNDQVLYGDIDGDKRTDMVLVTTKGQLSLFGSFTVSMHLHKNTAATGIPPKSNQFIKLKGATIYTQLVDISGDGKLDLVIPLIDTNLFTNLVNRLKGKIKVEYFIYFFKGPRFNISPNLKRTLWIPYDIVEGKTGIPIARFDGDFNGDGMGDMLFQSGENVFEIFLTEKKKKVFGGYSYSVSTKSPVKINTPDPRQMLVRDINGDGRSDMVMYYSPKTDKDHLVRIIMSRSK